jgi:hypothetical protein
MSRHPWIQRFSVRPLYLLKLRLSILLVKLVWLEIVDRARQLKKNIALMKI